MATPARQPFYCTDPDGIDETLARQLEHRHLLRGVSRLGLAVSGGADSVALFHLLLPVCRNAGTAVTVLHLNHGLRAEAGADEQFVRTLAAQDGVPFLSRRVTLADRPPDGRSLEMAAREARMVFFRQCGAEAGLDAIATGHQADDVAETLLLRLARGSGAAGLAGLRPRSRLAHSVLALIRPLLPIAGSALRAWLRQRGLTWREDASNSDPAIARNLIRHTVLPQLETAWVPDVRARLCRSAETLREDDALLETLAARELDALAPLPADPPSLPIGPLLQQPEALQRRILRQWFFRHGYPEAAGLDTVLSLIEACRSADGTPFQLPGGTFALCRGGLLSLPHPETASPPDATLPAQGTLRWGTVEITVESCRGVASIAHGTGVYPAVCTLSAQALAGHGVRVRARQTGDRIAPTGLRGSKKIQDLFVDEKIPEHRRGAIPVFACGDDVAWVPGYRVARRFAVPAPDAPSLRITVRQIS
ncbi:MAG: tRNA lysidine(34) synthetase TilS [Kiritimatiellae bacterium]|nr:tRNA lysidine(34) synthetase TilS [Kiritimatiellia bacterium]